MTTIENILTKHFGCTSPVFDNNTGGLTTDGKKSYKKLKALINDLAETKILDKNQAIKALDKIVETYVWTYNTDNISSDLSSLRSAVMGRSLFYYDSWNGSSMSITIDSIVIMEQLVLFTGPNRWGGRSGIYVDKTHLKELLSIGCVKKHNTIERCDVYKTWEIS